jgi:serine/threonine protein kinase
MDVVARQSGVPQRIGPFRVVRRLGAGGMAEAFEALRAGPGGFEQRVCLKRVLPGYSTDEDFVRMFLREARLAAALSHRNITRVVDFGEDAGCHYLALELVEGMDLRRLLRVGGRPVPARVAALVGLEVAEALDHAHRRGGKTGPVVHRDVSPANILASIDGDVKLTDFGISKALNEAAHTRSELVRGNLWYMAPEQLDGTHRSDPRSDLFSLGVVLYELLSNRRPYDGPTDIAAMRALSEGRRTPLLAVSPHAPTELAAVVEALLDADPDGRPSSAAAVVEALAPLTHPARDRRVLAELVCENRHKPLRPRAAAAMAPVTEELAAPSVAPASSVPSEWGAVPPEHPPAPPAAPGAGPSSIHGAPPGLPPGLGAHAPQPPAAHGSPTTFPGPRGAAHRENAPAPCAAATPPADASSRPASVLPARWQRYSSAPRAWASAERAAAQRRAEGRPLERLSPAPAEPEDLPTLPPSPMLWLTLAAMLVTAGMLGGCVLWTLV